ncbi:DUF551 domain-containing protein [Franconibacter helveticus]|uniref:DUF551 domain-containing protein n=1 Tax=Franconibacter helveticus TaxID=357240 RepID=UPI000DA1CB55
MQWISVKQSLPEASERILSFIVNTTEGVGIARYTPEGGFCDPILIGGFSHYGLSVTHWMPMPSPPAHEERHRLRGS